MPKISDLFSKGQHPVALYLSDRIESMHRTTGTLIIQPKNASFQKLTVNNISIQQILMPMQEYAWEFIAEATVISPDEMNQLRERLFRVLKPLECRIKWKGLIFREPVFEPLSGPLSFTEQILQQRVNPELSYTLNCKEKLIELIKKVRCDSVFIFVDSGIDVSNPFAAYANNLINFKESIVDYYRHPKRICWFITLVKGPADEFVRKKSTIIAIYNTLDMIGKLLRDLTFKKEKEISLSHEDN